VVFEVYCGATRIDDRTGAVVLAREDERNELKRASRHAVQGQVTATVVQWALAFTSED
jgi:hypothetical protein